MNHGLQSESWGFGEPAHQRISQDGLRPRGGVRSSTAHCGEPHGSRWPKLSGHSDAGRTAEEHEENPQEVEDEKSVNHEVESKEQEEAGQQSEITVRQERPMKEKPPGLEYREKEIVQTDTKRESETEEENQLRYSEHFVRRKMKATMYQKSTKRGGEKPRGSALMTDQTCEQRGSDAERGVQPQEQPTKFGTETGLRRSKTSFSRSE